MTDALLGGKPGTSEGTLGSWDNPAIIQVHHPVELLGEARRFVGCGHDSLPGTCKRVDGLRNSDPCARVNAGEGLVEEQDIGVLNQRPGDQYPLLLPPRQLIDPAVRERGEAEPVYRVSHNLAILRSRSPQPPQVNIPASHDQAANINRKSPIDIGQLWQVGDAMVAGADPEPGNTD